MACYSGNQAVIDQILEYSNERMIYDRKGHSSFDYLIIGNHPDLLKHFDAEFLKTRSKLIKYAIYGHANNIFDQEIKAKYISYGIHFAVKYNNLYALQKCITMEQNLTIKNSNNFFNIDSCKLSNNRNLCYLNSCMHLLYSMKMIRNSIELEMLRNPTIPVQRLNQIFQFMKDNSYSISDEIINDLNLFPSDEIHSQNDVSESLIKILSKLPIFMKVSYSFYTYDQFHEKAMHNLMLDLSIPPDDLDTIQEIINNDDPVFLNFPQYLIITIKRYRFNRETKETEKIQKRVYPNLLLNLSGSYYFQGDAFYKRYSGIVHVGINAKDGHYVALSYNDCNLSTRKYSDETITEIEENVFALDSTTKYIFCYILKFQKWNMNPALKIITQSITCTRK